MERLIHELRRGALGTQGNDLPKAIHAQVLKVRLELSSLVRVNMTLGGSTSVRL